VSLRVILIPELWGSKTKIHTIMGSPVACASL
jgi:hypothetical protein